MQSDKIMCHFCAILAVKKREIGGKMSTVRVFQRNRSFYADYTDAKGKRHRKRIAKNRRDANLIVAQIQANLDREPYGIPPDLTEIDLSSLITKFLNAKRNRIAESTLKRYTQYLKYFADFIESNFPTKTQVHLIRPVHIEEYIQSLVDKGNSPKTANESLSIIGSMLKYAKTIHHVIANSAKNIAKFPDSPDHAIEFFTEEEMNLILENSPERWRDVFEFFYLTGLRNGELINLTWLDVNFKNRQIKVESKTNWNTKTGNVRFVPLNDKAIEILKRCSRFDSHEYVFTLSKGTQISRQYPRKVLKKILHRTGLLGSPHKLRHTFASHLVMKSVSLYEVSQLLGHANISMTMKYAHLSPDHLRKAIEKL